MNRTLKEATVKRYQYGTRDQLSGLAYPALDHGERLPLLYVMLQIFKTAAIFD